MKSTSRKIDFVALVSSDKITLNSNPLVEIDTISRVFIAMVFYCCNLNWGGTPAHYLGVFME